MILIRSASFVKDSGWTLLHWAARTQNAKLAQRLLDLGANASATLLTDLFTPLHTLLCYGEGPSARATLKVFLEHERTSGPDVLLAPDTPLHCAAVNGDTGILEEILPRIPDVDISNRNGETALHFAARYGHVAAVDLLLEKGASKELRDSRGYLPFHYAACSDNTSVLELLQPKCVDDKTHDKEGFTALHIASMWGRVDAVKWLLDHNASVHIMDSEHKDKHGRTALEYAKRLGLEDIEKLLMARSDVRSHVDVMYKDRQVYVDAANAILVGAALIAGVAFAGWLQPPLGYAQYYDQREAYAAVRQSMGVRLFWGFNSLSFSFAIASMIAGLIAVVPIPGVYIGKTVQHLRLVLPIASSFLGLSLMLVLAAFGAAGFAVLPPLFKYQANMMATAMIGGIPCIILLTWFAFRVGPCIILLTWFARRLWCPHEELTN